MNITRRNLIAGAVAVPTTATAVAWLLADSGKRDPSDVSITTANGKRVVTANGMPDHATGDFPNSHDPVPMRPQKHKLEMPLSPIAAEKPVPLLMWLFGVAVNGVPFDPSGGGRLRSGGGKQPPAGMTQSGTIKSPHSKAPASNVGIQRGRGVITAGKDPRHLFFIWAWESWHASLN